MAREFRVRDPVHNFVYLWEPEVKLIATRVFQRLRGIRQLALANLVYPGALHTRFDHSLGVCHVAGLLAEQLGLDREEIRLVRLAALLHDLGHGPFSHVSENILERYADTSSLPADQRKEEIHERVTWHLIRNDPEIVHILGKETCDEVAKLLSEGHGQSALRSLVSGPLDADKQDYLLRDSLFCGVPYGVFDIHQLHRSLVVYGREEDDKDLMIDPDGIAAVEQFVLAKYFLTTNVYRHRVRLISDQMIVRAIVLGIEDDDLRQLRELYAFVDSDEFCRHYATWDDSRFLKMFGSDESDGNLCKELLQRLQRRHLHKQLFSEKTRVFSTPAVQDKLLKIGRKDSDALRKSIEQEIAALLQRRGFGTVDSRFVIVHGFDTKSVRTTSPSEEGGIVVAKTLRPFEQESTLFRSIREGYSEGFVQVYGPMSWETRTRRGKIKKTLVEPIKDILESKCK